MITLVAEENEATTRGHPEREPWETLGFELDVVRFSLYPSES